MRPPGSPSSYAGITLSDEGGLKRTHADPPICLATGWELRQAGGLLIGCPYMCACELVRLIGLSVALPGRRGSASLDSVFDAGRVGAAEP